MVIAAAPVVARRGGRGKGPGTVTVSREAWDEAQIEIAAHHAEALRLCAYLLPILNRFIVMAEGYSPTELQLAVGAERAVASYRARHEGQA